MLESAGNQATLVKISDHEKNDCWATRRRRSPLARARRLSNTWALFYKHERGYSQTWTRICLKLGWLGTFWFILYGCLKGAMLMHAAATHGDLWSIVPKRTLYVLCAESRCCIHDKKQQRDISRHAEQDGPRSLATACRCRNQRQAHVIFLLPFVTHRTTHVERPCVALSFQFETIVNCA